MRHSFFEILSHDPSIVLFASLFKMLNLFRFFLGTTQTLSYVLVWQSFVLFMSAKFWKENYVLDLFFL